MAGEILGMLLNGSLILLLVLLNGFFVAAEFAIVKVRATRIAQLNEEGNLRAKTVQKILSDLDSYLSATQLGITLASLGLGWVGEPFLARLFEPLLIRFGIHGQWIHVISFGAAFSLITYLHIVIGEMAPKSLAIRKAEQTALTVAKPLHWFFVLFRPTIRLLNRTAIRLLRWIGAEMVPDHQQAHTEDEIRMLVEQSHKSGIIDQTELSLFDNIFEFTDRIAREVMIPRVRMVCLYAARPFEENMEIIYAHPYTRYPLCGKDKDDILGIIHIRDVYQRLHRGEPADLKQLVRPAVFVPETMELKDILRVLQRHRTEMAIVADEYGGTYGLITIEDIVEEIVGEIQDEFDDERPAIQQESGGTVIDAGLLIEDVNEHFGLRIEDEENDTIGGWIFSRLKEIPQPGAFVDVGDFRFVVQEMSGRRITRLLVRERSDPGTPKTSKQAPDDDPEVPADPHP
ncbi:hemolysin family protein [Staphylospora marina]|uniref:hemolysin family protein n=1 Tax=Staphylospora marina TaxID=2490858 RepID=UPI001F14C9A0|nr:hemolysin family protein [Staphylospora marina]